MGCRVQDNVPARLNIAKTSQKSRHQAFASKDLAENVLLLGNIATLIEHGIANNDDIRHCAAAEVWWLLLRQLQRRRQDGSANRLDPQQRHVPIGMDD